MGTPLPPNSPGNPCGVCWGVGKEFGDISTPTYVIMQLFALEPGDDWEPDDEQLLLTPHTLFQAVTPCDWDIDDGVFKWNWRFTSTSTGCFVVRSADSRTVFSYDQTNKCLIQVPNDLDHPFSVIAFNGRAQLSWLSGGL